MRYEVEMSELAIKQYDNILKYIAYELSNPQALKSVMDDFDILVSELEDNAESFGFCKNSRLCKMGLRNLHFKRHRYLAVYRIKENKVIIEGIYHELQDYENAIR